MLPSFLYLAPEGERGGCDLPWAAERDFAVGEMARRQAAAVPTRTVAAAKSWLCNSRVDRTRPILPWNAPEEVAKVSPVEATRRYLEHMAAAWNAAFPDAPIGAQHVRLTVPASFDASARDLTREAARLAGLPEDLVLLEEPQAALYAWLAKVGDGWRRRLKLGDVLLVCDVGGGTTDFTLIRVEETGGDLQLARVAVGNHIRPPRFDRLPGLGLCHELAHQCDLLRLVFDVGTGDRGRVAPNPRILRILHTPPPTEAKVEE